MCNRITSVFVEQNRSECDFAGDDSWVILSPIEQSIKSKIEAIGTPLKDWDINIYRGILTGFNEAFIISTNKRNEILSNCHSDDERKRTEEIIRPILRGRDIKRYSYDWGGLYLVWVPWHFPLHLDNTIQGASEVAEKAFQIQYPSVYQHLLQYKPQLSARNKAETGIRYEWYALQRWGANYWEDFQKPKIIFQEIVQESQFVIDDKVHFYCNDTCRIITGKDLSFLVRILNSKLFFYSVKTFYGGGKLGESGVRMKHTFFNQFPCIRPNAKVLSASDALLIDECIYELYGLTPEEIDYIDNQ